MANSLPSGRGGTIGQEPQKPKWRLQTPLSRNASNITISFDLMETKQEHIIESKGPAIVRQRDNAGKAVKPVHEGHNGRIMEATPFKIQKKGRMPHE